MNKVLVPDCGEQKLLSMALKFDTPPSLTMRLFVNNITPSSADTTAVYTEMSTQGYAAKSISRADWNIVSTGGKAIAENIEKIFSFDGTGGRTPVYGYFITTDDDNTLLAVYQFDDPFIAQTAGSQVKPIPSLTLESVWP
ncbi:MAG: hypothetical protein ACM34K_17115 [Bacillota bacterium]